MTIEKQTTHTEWDLGFRWGRGLFTAAESANLSQLLARKMSKTAAASLGICAQECKETMHKAVEEALQATRELPSEAKIALFTHPTLSRWSENVIDALSRFRHESTPLPVSIISQDYMRLVAGASLAAGADRSFTFLSGTVLPHIGVELIGGDEGLTCEVAVLNNHLRIRSHKSDIHLPLQRCRDGLFHASVGTGVIPSFTCGGFNIHIDIVDPTFKDGWIPDAQFPGGIRLAAAAHEDLPEWSNALSAAAMVVEKILPETATMIGRLIKSFVPLVSSIPERAFSISDSRYPGAIMATIDGPPVLAETIVHEFRHNLLHQLEHSHPLYLQDSPTEARFYSPWRNDPRPLHGLLHALFVFIDVCAIHAGVRKHGFGDENDLDDSALRIAGNMLRLQGAIQEFQTHAKLTQFGQGFVEGISKAIDSLNADFESLPKAIHTQAIEIVHAHRKEFSRG